MQERLQKLIAQAGIASRRHAEELIAQGEVTVNGTVVITLGSKADPEVDHIKVSGKLINPSLERREKTYILLNKPKGYLSSASDPEGRKLVTDLVKGYGKLYPVGRLDYNTEGLIILTNDGDFTNVVSSSKKIPKVYEVKVKGLPTPVAINKLRRGVRLEDGFKTAPAQIQALQATDKNGWYEVILHEGHNQQIRKMFDSIGHSVVKLRRIAIGDIKDNNSLAGTARKLTEDEVKGLFEFKKTVSKTTAVPARDAASKKPRRPSRVVKAKKPKRSFNPRPST